MRNIVILIFTFFLLLSCARREEDCYIVPEGQSAKGFVIRHESNGTRIIFLSLQNKGEKTGELFVPDNKPFCRLVTTSVTHVGFLEALGAEEYIVGACDTPYLYNPLPNADDMGSSMAVDAERVVAVGADLVLQTYTGDSRQDGRFAILGIPTVMLSEWQEQDPLARAEWIKVFGAIVGKENEADSVFAVVSNGYSSIRQGSDDSESCENSNKQSIMSGAAWQGTWYVPDGNTYMAQLFRDAGAEYVYSDGRSGSSLPLSFEQALVDFRDADVWVGAPVMSLLELENRDEKNTWFKAFREGRVYSFLKRSHGSANDFWQTGVVHPEYILCDLVSILHNKPDSLLFFSKKLE